MTESISVEDLIDMGDHCFLCFRECSLEEDKNELDKDGKNVKVFLKTLERYLKLPDVNVDYVNEGDSNNIVKKQLRKKWHQLVRGRVCSHCNYLVNSTSGIFLEYERLKMLMDWKMREVDEHFQFIEENPNCNAAKQRLVEKWEKEERNSGLYLNMFKILKTDLSRIVARIELFPKVAAARLSDAIKPQSVPAIQTQTTTKLQVANEPNQTESRQRHVSFCDDSGVSIDSGLSQPPSPHGEEKAKSKTVSNSSERNSHRKSKQRKTYQCKNCTAKFFTKEKQEEHVNAKHCSTSAVAKSKKSSQMEQDFIPDRMASAENSVSNGTSTGESLTATNSGQFECADANCKKTFATVEDLTHHSLFHRSLDCPFCTKRYQGPTLLARHEFHDHRNKADVDIRCPRCGPDSEVFEIYSEYASHFLKTHLPIFEKPTRCLKCNCHHTAGTKCQQLTLDPATCKECSICNLRLASFAALHSHVVAEHDPNIKGCYEPGCERLFGNEDAYDLHRSNIHGELKMKINFCKYCKTHKTFKSADKFRAHIERHEKKEMRRVAKLREEEENDMEVDVETTAPTILEEQITRGEPCEPHIASPCRNESDESKSPKRAKLSAEPEISLPLATEICCEDMNEAEALKTEPLESTIQSKSDNNIISLTDKSMTDNINVEVVDLISDDEDETVTVAKKEAQELTSKVLKERVKSWLKDRHNVKSN